MSETLLIADDDEIDVEFLRQAIREVCATLEVKDVPDGQEAVEYLAGRGKYEDRARFPLPTRVVLDIKMPRRSGLEVLEWIRAQPPLAKLPVFVLSGSQLDEDRRRAHALGAEFFIKPVEYAALLDIARRFCSSSGGQ